MKCALSTRGLPPFGFTVLPLPRPQQKARNSMVEANQAHPQGLSISPHPTFVFLRVDQSSVEEAVSHCFHLLSVLRFSLTCHVSFQLYHTAKEVCLHTRELIRLAYKG